MKEGLNTNLSYILNDNITEEQEVENKQKERSNGRYFFISILLIVLIYLSIMFTEEIKTFYNDISNKYFSKDTKIEKSIYREKPLEKQVSTTNVRKENTAVEKVREIEKIKEVIVTKEATNEDLINKFNTDNFKILKCTNYRIHKYDISDTCKKNLDVFINENKNAFRFEVTATLSQNDIKGYLKYKAYLEEVLMAGISTKRVSEIIWYIKQQLPENSIITSKEYYVKTDDPVSSVVVKAYH